MKSKARYSLIVTGIIVFIVLSPFVYLLIRGVKYDFKNHRFISTGIFSASSEPKNADIFLDGKKYGTTNTNIRFITPGDYNIEIKKDKYFTWSKRLNIREQFVTTANLNLTALTLFLSEPNKILLAKDVTNLFAGDQRLIYLQNNKIITADISNPLKTYQIQLPDSTSNFEITASSDENYFLFQNPQYTELLDARANKLIDLTDLITKQAAYTSTSNFQASDTQLMFSDSDELFQLQSGSVYKIDLQNLTKKVIIDNVLAFYPTGQNIYYIAVDAPTGQPIHYTLNHAEAPQYQPSVLLSDLPPFHTAELYLSDRNQLFILGDGSIYSLDNGLHKLTDYVKSASIDNESKKLLYSTSNEINSYDLANGSVSLITRSSSEIKNPIAVFKLGWIFLQSNGQLSALELDNRDHQNNYSFARISDNAKFYVDKKAKNIYLLNNGELDQLVIR
ncbi:MAG: hypothetical protein NVSMB66_0820 [Candidatus Doudnabacteria bacterium]